MIVDLESIEFEHLYHYRALYDYIISKIDLNHINYVIIDEVQNAFEFQKAVDSLYIHENIDLYLTGSNSKILSGELATLLSGRYVTIHVLPLSFKEYNLVSEDKLVDRSFRDFMRWGGLPYVTKLLNNDELINQYLEGIYSTVFKKDILDRYQVNETSILDEVIKYIFDNIGKITSSKKISDTLTSNGRKISRPTVDNYLQYVVESYMAYKVIKYDIKGKNYLKSLEKYYVSDLGLKHHLLGYRNRDRGFMLENVVYLELIPRGFDVYIGKNGEKEIDFIAKNKDQLYYIQVCESIKNESTFEREIEALSSIQDFHPRIIIVDEYVIDKTYQGIKIINLIEWLLDQEKF